MKFDLSFYLAISCGLPAIAGLVRINTIERKIYPFVAALWLALFCELTVGFGVAAKWPHIVSIVYNIFIPLNLLLLLLFFRLNGIIATNSVFFLLLAISLLGWVGAFVYNKTYFTVFTFSHNLNCAIIVILGTKLLSREVLTSKISPAINFFFLVACGMIILYLFYLFITSTMMLGASFSATRAKMFKIYEFVNAGVYLLFFYAILCLQKKTIYSM
jgi:hypothetical protein